LPTSSKKKFFFMLKTMVLKLTQENNLVQEFYDLGIGYFLSNWIVNLHI